MNIDNILIFDEIEYETEQAKKAIIKIADFVETEFFKIQGIEDKVTGAYDDSVSDSQTLLEDFNKSTDCLCFLEKGTEELQDIIIRAKSTLDYLDRLKTDVSEFEDDAIKAILKTREKEVLGDCE